MAPSLTESANGAQSSSSSPSSSSTAGNSWEGRQVSTRNEPLHAALVAFQKDTNALPPCLVDIVSDYARTTMGDVLKETVDSVVDTAEALIADSHVRDYYMNFEKYQRQTIYLSSSFLNALDASERTKFSRYSGDKKSRLKQCILEVANNPAFIQNPEQYMKDWEARHKRFESILKLAPGRSEEISKRSLYLLMFPEHPARHCIASFLKERTQNSVSSPLS